MFTQIDYIAIYWTVFFLSVTPLLFVKKPIDIIAAYVWVVTVIYSKLPFNFYPKYTLPVRLSIENNQNELLILVGVLVLMLKTKFDAKWILQRLAMWSLLLSLIAIPFQERWVSGIVVNKSMNAVLCTALLPYIYEPLTLILTAIVVLCSKSSSAYLSFFGVLLVIGAPMWRSWATSRMVGWGLGSILTLFLVFFLDRDLFFAGSRFDGYKFFFNDFSCIEFIFGKGPASFFSISAYRQAKEMFELNNGYNVWLHSDLLQFIYEYGFIGLIPLLIYVVRTLKIIKKPEFYSLLAMTLGGVFYYPFHFPVHLFVIFLVLKVVHAES